MLPVIMAVGQPALGVLVALRKIVLVLNQNLLLPELVVVRTAERRAERLLVVLLRVFGQLALGAHVVFLMSVNAILTPC